MMRNPLHITYRDLLKEQMERLTYMERDYRRRVTEGSMTAYMADRKIEMQKRLVKLLQRFEQNQQINLFAEYQKMN